MGRLQRIIDWIDARVDKPAKRKPVNPGSEQMINSETPKAWAASSRRRGAGSGRRGI
jgi:hypothetical protein